MNNKYFFPLLCVIVLATAPACNKQQPKATPQEDVKTLIELDNTVFETEEEINEQNVAKF
jgi:hypothetical protein